MGHLEIKLAEKKDLAWINLKYDEVGFLHSSMEDELVAIAYWNGEPAGLGRIDKVEEKSAELGGMYVFPEFRGLGIAGSLVSFLLNNSQASVIYCLPFCHLKEFYEKFGFQQIKNEKELAPEKVLLKHQWCNRTYEGETLLLVKKA